eukprot:EG_transcript_866
MRLAAIFLGVLAASALLASLAAWGTMYGTSHDRITTMSSEFAALSNAVLGQFRASVAELLQEDAQLLNSFLALEQDSGVARIQETKASMENTIGTLVNWTVNATDQSQAQMAAVVDTFASLMGSVVADFKGVANVYAAQLRASLAAKLSAVFMQMIVVKMTNTQRFQALYAMGLLNFSAAPSDPIAESDCTLLGVLCTTAVEMATLEALTLTLATGRSYTCTIGREASISRISVNGSQYTEQRLMFVPTASSVLLTKQMCMAQASAPVAAVGSTCPLPQGCGCGQDPRCVGWYASHAADTSPNFARGDPFRGTSGAPSIEISYSLFNLRAAPPSLVAVVSNNIEFAVIDSYLTSMVTVPGMVLATLLNDTALTAVGSSGAKCAANVTPPGDPSLPSWSSLRSCEPGLRVVAQWVLQNRAVMSSSATLLVSGVVWDIFVTDLSVTSYFAIIGVPLAVINAAVDASGARASAQLATVRAQQQQRVAGIGDAAKAYLAALGRQNLEANQAQQRNFMTQLEGLQNTSRDALVRSQQRSAGQVQQMTQKQRSDIEALTATHLSAMTVTTGWTLGVLFAILLVVLLCSAAGTVQVTGSLDGIIEVMEDVADMKVENLVIPRRSHVAEVARIEAAFQVLVHRLAEYKSYIPAGVFEQMRQEKPRVQGNDPEGDCPSGSDAASARRVSSQPLDETPRSAGSAPPVVRGHRLPGCSSFGSVYSVRHTTTHRVAALAVHAAGLTGQVMQLAPAQARVFLSEYVTNLHEAVSQSRGNVDYVAGDQALVTFNAHIPCGDPAGAAVTAAFEVYRILQEVAHERVRFQIGIAFGPAFSGSVGYNKFRSMVTFGAPMKVASLLSHLSHFESGSIVADAAVEEKLHYNFNFRPAEVVRFPQDELGTSAPRTSRIFLLQGKKHLQEQEWMYQLDQTQSDWTSTFNLLAKAPTTEEMQSILFKYLAAHPQDPVALRLRGRLPLWVPGMGVAL